MIECVVCGEWFHSDAIRFCPECGVELCGECCDNHAKCCLSKEGWEQNIMIMEDEI